MKSAYSLPTRCRRVSTRLWRRRTLKSPSSTFASRSITHCWMTLVMECISARSSRVNAPRAKFQSNQLIHRCRRLPRSHLRLLRWAQYELALDRRSLVTQVLWENRAVANIAHRQSSSHHKCHHTMHPTTRWVILVARTATRQLNAVLVTVHCQCRRASRSRCI